MKKVYLLLLPLIISCTETYENFKIRTDLIGTYCGNTDFTITLDSNNFNQFIFKTFSGRIFDFEAIFYGNSFEIVEQKYFEEETGQFRRDKYLKVITGNGMYYPDSLSIIYIYNTKKIRENKPDEITIDTVIAYKSTVGEFIGKYSNIEDSVVVDIFTISDSMFIDLYFPLDWDFRGWEKIPSLEKICSIKFSSDSVIDIKSGEYYSINGNLNKLGKKLHLSFATKYHNFSPLIFYDCLLTEVEESD